MTIIADKVETFGDFYTEPPQPGGRGMTPQQAREQLTELDADITSGSPVVAISDEQHQAIRLAVRLLKANDLPAC